VDVDGVQARLTVDSEGFWLSDLDSQTGTWVNYRRVGTHPVRIQPGDLIHFGNCGFRFTMVERTLPDAVHIYPYEPLL
jgi:pSer/pThr/pTyr-binding forkhead associated (FHA) protein